MNTNQERDALAKAYAQSKTWPDKLKKMSDGQIHAIFMNLVARGKVKA